MAEETQIESLKKLSPKERISKLKEIQKKDHEEIEKAQKLIRESEEQVAIEEEIENIPIPQLRAVDVDELFTAEEKALFRAKRFAGEKRKQQDEEQEERAKEEKQERLEELAEEAPAARREEQIASQMQQYINQLSKKPAEVLENRMRDIYNQAKETGYITQQQQREMENIHYATQKKMHALEAGEYKEATREVAEEMVLTERMRGWMHKYARM